MGRLFLPCHCSRCALVLSVIRHHHNPHSHRIIIMRCECGRLAITISLIIAVYIVWCACYYRSLLLYIVVLPWRASVSRDRVGSIYMAKTLFSRTQHVQSFLAALHFACIHFTIVKITFDIRTASHSAQADSSTKCASVLAISLAFRNAEDRTNTRKQTKTPLNSHKHTGHH